MARLKILLAEDNRGDVLLIREALKEHGVEHELVVLADGAQALEYIDEIGDGSGAGCPDVFLLDLNLPKADGIQVLEHFRKNPWCREKPVVIVTSSDAPRDRERAQRLSAQYFRKSSEIDEYMRLGAVVKEAASVG